MGGLHIGIECNIHKDKASKVLTLNRNKIRSEYKNTLIKDIFYSSYKILINNFNNIFIDEESKSFGSMFLHYYADEEYLKEFDISSFNQWENFEIQIQDSKYSLKQLLNTISSLKLIYDNNANFRDEYSLDKEELTIKLKGGSAFYDYTDFLLFKASDVFTAFTETEIESKKREICFTKDNQKSPLSHESIKNILERTKNNFYSARNIIPCLEKYFDLRIKNDAHLPYIHHYRTNPNIYLEYPKMLSPYISKESKEGTKKLEATLNEKLYDWVFNNRYNTVTTKEQIVEAYKIFLEDFQL